MYICATANQFWCRILHASYSSDLYTIRFEFQVGHLEWISTSRWVNFCTPSPGLEGWGGSRWEFMLNMYSVTSIFLAFSSSCHCNLGVGPKKQFESPASAMWWAHMFLAIVTDTNAHVLLRFVFSFLFRYYVRRPPSSLLFHPPDYTRSWLWIGSSFG